MDRSKTIDELQSSDARISSPGTLRVYSATLNGINDYYGWDRDVIYYDRLNSVAEKLPLLIQGKWHIKNITSLKQKLSGISSLMTRCCFGTDNEVKLLIKTIGRDDENIVDDVVDQPKTIPSWIELKKKLTELGKENSVRGTIAKVLSYGYVLRPSELFTTRIDGYDGTHNFLDLDKCKWIVRNHRKGNVREFDVDPELCKRIPRGKWLLHKLDGTKWSTGMSSFFRHKWTLPDGDTIRKSFEIWNTRESGNDEMEQRRYNNIIGNNVELIKYKQKIAQKNT